MKQRDLEALAARYFAAPEADEALLAEEARMCATLPEAWQATLAETAGFHDWHLLELSLRGGGGAAAPARRQRQKARPVAL